MSLEDEKPISIVWELPEEVDDVAPADFYGREDEDIENIHRESVDLDAELELDEELEIWCEQEPMETPPRRFRWHGWAAAFAACAVFALFAW